MNNRVWVRQYHNKQIKSDENAVEEGMRAKSSQRLSNLCCLRISVATVVYFQTVNIHYYVAAQLSIQISLHYSTVIKRTLA